MQKVSALAKRLVDKDTQTLIKAEFLNTDLSLTDEGRRAFWAVLFESNKAALVKEAQERIEEIKDNK